MEKSSNRYKRYLLAVLLLILASNFVDRLALGLLLEDIKRDLHLTDTQLGFMTGIAFALFYSIMGIPIARWADRGNRVLIISLSAALWGVLVSVCGLATSFTQMLLIRVGIGVGEAGCVPAAYSLISDNFSRAERPKASAIYALGAPLSFLLGYFPAGWISQSYGWRVTFMLAGIPGVLLAVLAEFTLREPRRGKSAAGPGRRGAHREQPASAQPSLRLICTTLWAIPSFRHLLLCYSVLFFFANGILQWQPTYFVRSYGLETGVLGTWLALIYGLGGLLGTYWGGEFASRHARHNESMQLRVAAGLYVVLGMSSLIIYVSSSRYVAFAAVAVSTVGMYSTSGPLWATIQTVVPGRMRATAIAVLYLCANLIGTGFGPLAIGALSDVLVPWAGQDSLRYALAAATPGYLWAAWHLWRSSGTVAYDIEAVQHGDQRASYLTSSSPGLEQV